MINIKTLVLVVSLNYLSSLVFSAELLLYRADNRPVEVIKYQGGFCPREEQHVKVIKTLESLTSDKQSELDSWLDAHKASPNRALVSFSSNDGDTGVGGFSYQYKIKLSGDLSDDGLRFYVPDKTSPELFIYRGAKQGQTHYEWDTMNTIPTTFIVGKHDYSNGNTITYSDIDWSSVEELSTSITGITNDGLIWKWQNFKLDRCGTVREPLDRAIARIIKSIYTDKIPVVLQSN